MVINDANEAVLGSLTQLGQGSAGGTLTAGSASPSDSHAHFLLEEGKNLTGHGTVDGHFKNHGHVVGDGTDGSQRLVFSSPWTISGEGTFENTLILGTFAPGNSLRAVNGTNQGFGGAVEIELGGTTAGFAGGHYDQINDSASILLAGSVTLSILPWDGFVPAAGQRFDIVTWQEGLSVPFGAVQVDPYFADRGISFELDYYNASGAGGLTLVAVPESSTLALLAVGALALLILAWQRRRPVALGAAIRI